VNNWARWAIYTAAVWAGALIVSLLVAEWREPDLGQIESDLREIKAAQPVVVVSDGSIVPTPFVSTTPIPSKTVELKEGTEVDYAGAHYTVTQVRPGRVEFILEGPHPVPLGQTFKVLDEEGFVCDAGINASPAAALAEGEKTRMYIGYTCRRGHTAQKLFLEGMTFEAQ
jgi:hypothetical protein